MTVKTAVTMSDAEHLLAPKGMLIAGEWVTEGSGQLVHINPSTGREHPPLPLAGAPEVERAVAAARSAFGGWRAMPVDARRDIMLRLAGLIRQHAGELAMLTTLDNGAPPRNAMSGVTAAIDHFTYFAGWVDKIGGDVIPTWPAPALDYAIMEPYGVVGVIIPWNVPMHNVGQVLGAALAAGNCVVLKAPDLAPFAVLRFGELAIEAGIPAGVVNILPGGAQCGAAMVAHAGVDKIHYIGGAVAAKLIMKSAADTLKPVTFELGGKSANIVFADADLRNAIGLSAFMGVALSGQGCLLPTRLLVEDSIYDQVVPMVVGLIQSMKVGNPFAEGTALGPVINAAACEWILGVIELAKAEGATLLTGGERLGGDLAEGYFLAPTVFGDVDHKSNLSQQEVFGPVLAILRFKDEAEAIAMANDTEYGLAAYVHTNDLRRAHRIAAALEAGTVNINGTAGTPSGAPFGGVKQSGFGSMGGKYGLHDFLRPKNVYIPLS